MANTPQEANVVISKVLVGSYCKSRSVPLRKYSLSTSNVFTSTEEQFSLTSILTLGGIDSSRG